MRTVSIPLKEPHSDKQEAMITYPGNVVAFCGRRFGKTDGYVQRLFYQMQRQPGLYWWVGLSWKSASLKRAWREVTKVGRQVLWAMDLDERTHINRSRFELALPGLGEIWFRTADNPGSLAGEGIRGAVVDEFSLMSEIVWSEYLQATLLDHDGWVAFGGVPKGRNWAARLWQAASYRERWLQVHATTYENPFIDPALIDKTKRETPEQMFRQEYLAEVLDDAGLVFRGVRDCIVPLPAGPNPDTFYVMGVDWAQSQDWTVLTVMDVMARNVVAIERFNRIEWHFQRQRLVVLAQRWGVERILAEHNSIGGPNIEALQRDEALADVVVDSFTTTSQSKAEIVQELMLAFERTDVGIPDNPTLIAELEAFEATRLASGRWRYEAPSGMHDDMVISLMLTLRAAADGERARRRPLKARVWNR